MARFVAVAVFLAGCAGHHGDDGGPTGPKDSDTGTTTVPGYDCTDGLWLSGAYWSIGATLSSSFGDWPTYATDLGLDPAGNPVVLVNHVDPSGGPRYLSVRWRGADDLEYQLPRGADWSGIYDPDAGTAWSPFGEVLAVDPDGITWIAGRLTDGTRNVPFAARFDQATGQYQPWVLNPDVTDGNVTAGPVFTADGVWFLGTIVDPAVGESELVAWLIGPSLTVDQVYRGTDLADGDVTGVMVAGAMTATADDRVLIGGGSVAGDHVADRGFLLAGDASGFAEALSLPPSATGGVAGAIGALTVRDDRLVYVWGATGGAAYAQPSWQVFDGAVSDPAGAVLVDGDAGSESAVPRDAAIHPSGAVLVGGSLAAQGAPAAIPYVRMGRDGSWGTSFAPPGDVPGWISSVDVDAAGYIWALCVYSEDGRTAYDTQIITLGCQL